MRTGLQNYGWLLVVAGTFSVYVWGPIWPHAVARYPVWPWLPLFSIMLVLTALYLRKRSSAGSVLFGTTVVAMYFYIAALVEALIYEKLAPLSVVVVPFLNVLIHLPVIAIFAALGAAIAMLGRMNKPAAIGH